MTLTHTLVRTTDEGESGEAEHEISCDVDVEYVPARRSSSWDDPGDPSECDILSVTPTQWTSQFGRLDGDSKFLRAVLASLLRELQIDVSLASLTDREQNEIEMAAEAQYEEDHGQKDPDEARDRAEDR